MKNISMLKPALVTFAGVMVFTGGCVYRERTVYRHPPVRVVTAEPVGSEVIVTEPPPAPILETITVSPGPGFVWISGGWVWRGHWVWERGHWERPVRAGAVWLPHRYVYRGGVHIYVRGGWR